MATLVGTNEAKTVVLKAGGSPQLEAYAALFTTGVASMTVGLAGSFSLQLPAVAPSSFAATHAPMYGRAVLWEKIIVTPRTIDLGFVLSATAFDIDVWNTHASTLASLTAVQVSGEGNVTVADPYGVPLGFGPFQSRSYRATMPTDGDASVANTITFEFAGETGTDIQIVGLRISLFAFDPSWDNGFRERTEFATAILKSYGDNEQRVQLRTVPRTRLLFLVRTMSARETGLLDSLLYGWQARIYGVPFWPDAQPLGANVAAGDSVLAVDTNYRKFQADGMCMLWRDAFTAETLTVLSVTASTVVLAAPLSSGWAADGQTWVVPVLRGRLPDNAEERRLSGQLAELDAEFECEVI